jgi:16S rRNA (cytidine1402-2'-O)-methyltransferase
MQNQFDSGILYIVATPIGNPKDITLRAVDILSKIDAVICEEYRRGSRLLNQLNISKELITLNEHNETEQAQVIAQRLKKGESMAIISDAGTPVFADPGQHLLQLLYQNSIRVSPIPGPSSLMSALSLCDFSIERFIFAGFPPQKTHLRERFLSKFKGETIPIILMDTPYRLTKLLGEVEAVFGKTQDVLLACNMTQKKEMILRGKVGDILSSVSGQKHEFILILNLNQKSKRRSGD